MEKNGGRKYRDVDESLVQADKIYRAEESYSTVDGAVHDTIAVKIDYQMEGKEKMAVSDPMGHHPAKDLRTRTDCRQRRTGKSAEQTKS